MGRQRRVDVAFVFEEGEPEADGYVPLDLKQVERVRCDLTEEQALGVGEHWAQSDFYGVDVQSDLIGVVADGDVAKYNGGLS